MLSQVKVKKRHMILLEVMIALALIALCVLPLLAPHAFLLKQQKQFISTIELDHAVNLLYADMLEKLHKQEIPWQGIQEGTVFPIDESAYKRINYDKTLPFTGTFRFEDIKHKINEKEQWGVHLLKLIFTFVPTQQLTGAESEKKIKPLEYSYQVFVTYQSGEKHVDETSSSEGQVQPDGKSSDTRAR